MAADPVSEDQDPPEGQTPQLPAKKKVFNVKKYLILLLCVSVAVFLFAVTYSPADTHFRAFFQIPDKTNFFVGRAKSLLGFHDSQPPAASLTTEGGTDTITTTEVSTTSTTESTTEFSHPEANIRPLPPSWHPDHEALIKDRFARRLRTLRAACKRYAGKPSVFWKHKLGALTLENYPPAMNVSVAYCPIEKVASTTWKRIFHAIRMRARGKQRRAGANIKSPPFAERDVVFAFTREPYGRLLSAYNDKLFSPNTLYWRIRGQYIVSKFRANASRHSLACGHDVTFPEFIKFFISIQTTGVKRDGHFTPIHDHCQFCQQPYQYIGHLETIKEDMPFLLKTIRSPVMYNKTFENVTISNNCITVLGKMRAGVKRCEDLDEASRRLWKKWQIRGFISKHIPFPLKKKETRDIHPAGLTGAALKAVDRSRDKGSRVGQKREALREAFGSVPLRDRLQVKRLLAVDFEMFGFDPEPDEVFPRKPYKPDPNFSYFDLYK